MRHFILVQNFDILVYLIAYQTIDYIKDSFKGMFKLYNLVKAGSIRDKETTELLEEFETEYLQVGIEIFTGFARIFVLATIVLAQIFLDSNHPFYWRSLTIWPSLFVMFWVVDKYWRVNKNVCHIMLIIIIVFWGLSVTQENLRSQSYSFYEVWACFIFDWQFIGILMFLKWRSPVIAFYIIIMIYVFLLNWFY